MLDIIDLSFDYSEKPLLQGVNLSLNAGCLLHLRGDNGKGKTTLLKLLAGILQPIHGFIRYNGHPIKDDLQTFQQTICYVGHKPGISSTLTVKQNLRFDLRNDINASLDDLMGAFSLQGLANVPCGLLSAGQRRRVALLRLRMCNASLWLLDEPLVALDTPAIDILMRWMNQHLEQNGQIILTSHQSLPLKNVQEYCL